MLGADPWGWGGDALGAWEGCPGLVGTPWAEDAQGRDAQGWWGHWDRDSPGRGAPHPGVLAGSGPPRGRSLCWLMSMRMEMRLR